MQIAQFEIKTQILSYEIKQIQPKKRVAIYGAGGFGQEIFQLLGKSDYDIEVLCFLDSFKQGRLFNLPIYNFSEFEKKIGSVDVILVASVYQFEIFHFLVENGVKEFAIPLLEKTWEAFVIDEWKTIYLVNNKAAFSSITLCLSQTLGIGVIEASAKGYLRRLDQIGKYSDYFIFSVVRNPYERLVSCYEHFFNRPGGSFETQAYAYPISQLLSTSKNPISFDIFAGFVFGQDDIVADRHWRSQHSLLSDRNEKLLPHIIGRFETLNEDFSEISKQVGKKISLPHINKSKKRLQHYTDYYSTEIKELIKKRYLNDLKEFNYQFG